MPDKLQRTLRVTTGQYSDKGRKPSNQDFHGVYIPVEPQLSAKGIAIALADGISSSDVSHIASDAAVTGFLEDYFCTSEAWSTKKSAQRVLTAINSWLHAQTRYSENRYDANRGYVCTFSAVVIKSATAHLFHVGDSRIYRLRDKSLEQLTTDHRIRVSDETSYLARALGMNPQLEIDYQALPAEQGDIFVLATDGVHEYARASFIADAIKSNPSANPSANPSNFNGIAKAIADEALHRGSPDNLTIQIARIDELPLRESDDIVHQLTALPFPPALEARMMFDGFKIVRELHASSRSHVFLALDEAGTQVVIKTPSVDLQHDPAYLERFLMEEWIARRINNAHVLKPCAQTRKRNYLYLVTEFIEGQTLTQWMIDHPQPDVETVRGVIEQIGKGLQAFHRLEMLHQDLRPENIMIDHTGTAKIIDFGSTRVAGLMEIASPIERNPLLGTAQYTAPEYFLGEAGSNRSDIFSLGVIAYQMLSGRLPYGAEVAKARTKAAQKKLGYHSVTDEHREIPAWVDATLKKAVHADPNERYGELSEFIYELRHPNQAFMNKQSTPLLERNPLLVWQCISLTLAILVAILLWRGAN